MWLFDRYTVSGILVTVALAWLLAIVFARRTCWSERKIAIVAALPLPALVSVLCLYVLVGAFTASSEECGVDACGMAAAASMIMLLVAGLAFALGLITARIVLRKVRR